MLGRFRMTTDEALKEYHKLAEDIFGTRKDLTHGYCFKATVLEDKMKTLVAEQNQGQRLIDPAASTSARGLTFVCSTPKDDMSYVERFRTYKIDKVASPNCEIWEAARATSAAPMFFKSIKIDDGTGGKLEYVDGGLKCNNPSKQVMDEARAKFGSGRMVGYLLSIGAGHASPQEIKEPKFWQNNQVLAKHMVDAITSIVTDCEETAEELSKRYGEHSPRFYYRFSVEQGAQDIALEECKKMNVLNTRTRAYMLTSRVSREIDELVQLLCVAQPVQGRTFASLG